MIHRIISRKGNSKDTKVFIHSSDTEFGNTFPLQKSDWFLPVDGLKASNRFKREKVLNFELAMP